MSRRYNEKRLREMLQRDDLDRDDKQAIRFAVWCISQVCGGSPISPVPEIPYWRYVRYTDDGCALYQCLNCKQQYEGRTAPGWYDDYETVDGPGPGVMHYMSTVNGEQVPRYYRKREEPLYKPTFTYCPFCGVEFKSAIRPTTDNEHMLGERRQRIEKALYDRRAERVEPSWWWVIQRREVWADREQPEPWEDEGRIDPNKKGALEAYRELQYWRERCREDDKQSGGLWCKIDHEARIVKMTNEELNKRHPGWHKPREL